MALSDLEWLGKILATRSIGWPLCDSWASCYVTDSYFLSHWYKATSPILFSISFQYRHHNPSVNTRTPPSNCHQSYHTRSDILTNSKDLLRIFSITSYPRSFVSDTPLARPQSTLCNARIGGSVMRKRRIKDSSIVIYMALIFSGKKVHNIATSPLLRRL